MADADSILVSRHSPDVPWVRKNAKKMHHLKEKILSQELLKLGLQKKKVTKFCSDGKGCDYRF